MLGSGTIANDVVAAQLRRSDERGLVLVNGEFGERLSDHARRAGATFDVERLPWGVPFDGNAIERALAAHPAATWVWMVHLETSTGVVNDLPRLTTLAHARGMRIAVDGVSAIGSISVQVGDVDFATAVSGKGIGSVPGVAIICHRERVTPDERIARSLDLGLYAGAEGVPFTLSSNLIWALSAALGCAGGSPSGTNELVGDTTRWAEWQPTSESSASELRRQHVHEQSVCDDEHARVGPVRESIVPEYDVRDGSRTGSGLASRLRLRGVSGPPRDAREPLPDHQRQRAPRGDHAERHLPQQRRLACDSVVQALRRPLRAWEVARPAEVPVRARSIGQDGCAGGVIPGAPGGKTSRVHESGAAVRDEVVTRQGNLHSPGTIRCRTSAEQGRDARGTGSLRLASTPSATSAERACRAPVGSCFQLCFGRTEASENGTADGARSAVEGCKPVRVTCGASRLSL